MTDLDSARRFAQRPASTTHNVKAALDYSSVSFERGKSRTREGASTFPDVPSAGSGFEVCGAILSLGLAALSRLCTHMTEVSMPLHRQSLR